MKSFKKLLLLTCSFITCLSVGLFSACGEPDADSSTPASSSTETPSAESSSVVSSDETSRDDETSSSEDSTSSDDETSSSEDSTSSDDETSRDDETSSSDESSSSNGTSSGDNEFVCDGVNHVWAEWVKLEDPGCLTVGKKQRTCLGDVTHVETADITERGHDYGNVGVCIRCKLTPDLPKYDGSTPIDVHDFPNKDEDGDGIHYGEGKNYTRWELAEDNYYSIEIPRKGDAEEQGFWVSFAVSEPGQYALYSVQNNNVKATRFDASVQYIPPTGYDALYLQDGNFVSTVNCTTTYWSANWRATFHLTAEKANATATFILTRIDAPAWRPGYVHASVIAEEIDNKKAPEGAEGTQAVVVPYESDYFFDESVGYYRMGTKLNPGEIIYVAIDCNPPRLMTAGDNPGFFTTIQWSGNNLCLGDGYTADGDYLLRDYMPFIMNDPSYGGNPGNCYQDFVNSDGMYPVNQELFRFLNLYVQNNRPMEIDQEIVDDDALYAKCAWLAPCYYYKKVKVGTEEVPHQINTMGQHTITTWEEELQYFTVRYQNYDSENPTTYCTISCDDAKAFIILNGETIFGPFRLLFETNEINGTTFAIAEKDGSEIDLTFTLATWDVGSMDNPEQVEVTNNTVTLTPYKAFLCSGDIDYVGYYAFTAETTGTITLTTDCETLLLVNSEPAVNTPDGTSLTYTLEVTEGDVVELYVQAQIPDNIIITITDDSEEPAPDEPSVNTNPNVLALGTNQWTGVTYNGNKAVFTATEAGMYALSSDTTENAKFYQILSDGFEELTLPYSFTLAEGETFTLNACALKFGKTTDVTVVFKKATSAPTETTDLEVGGNEIEMVAGQTIALKMTFTSQAYGPLTAPAGIRIGDWDAGNATVVSSATNEYTVSVSGGKGGEVVVYAVAEASGTYTFELVNYVSPISTTEMEGEINVPTAFGFSVPVTFTIANPGNYLIESWNDVEYTSIQTAVFGMGGNTYSFTTTEENQQITLYIANHNFASKTAVVDYLISEVLPVSLTDAGGTLKITANADVVVEFTASAAGTYVIGSTNKTVSGWFDSDVDHSMLCMYPLIVTVTDPSVPVKFNVHIDDMNYVTVDVPFTVDVPQDLELTTGTYTDLEVIANAMHKVIFTAPTAGNYLIQIETAGTFFGIMNADSNTIAWTHEETFTFSATEDNQEVILYVKNSFALITFTISLHDADSTALSYEMRVDEDGNGMTESVVVKANGTTTIEVFGRGSYELSWIITSNDVTITYNETELTGSSILFVGSGTAIFTLSNVSNADVTVSVTLAQATLYSDTADVFVEANSVGVTATITPTAQGELSWTDENLKVTVMKVTGDTSVEVPVSGMSVTLESNTTYEITFGSANAQQLIATVTYALA